MAEDDAADRQDCVDRNVQHLELMVAKDDWGGLRTSQTQMPP
jgi:hypothetical protein